MSLTPFKTDPQQEFIKALMKKFSKKVLLADFLSDTLCIEKDSAYRRLRGEVQFSLQEACFIAEKLSISIDEIIGIFSPKTRPLSYRIINYIEPEEIDFQMCEEYLDLLRESCDDPEARFAMTAKMIPPTFYLQHEMLRNFYLLKWIYQYSDKPETPKISEVKYDNRLLDIFSQETELYNSMPHTDIVFHEYIYLRIIQDIRYFIKLGLIGKDELAVLKQELFATLDQLERMTKQGFNHKGNKVDMYISNMNFDTPTHYIQCRNYCLTLIRAFTINDIKTFDHITFEWARKYVESLKKTSIFITKCGDIQRTQYFNEQRELIDNMI